MYRQPHDNTAEALRRLLHCLAEALESRLADRLESWLRRLRRGGRKPESSNG